jgi:post-segregation antitoxin (ccd killing protein)
MTKKRRKLKIQKAAKITIDQDGSNREKAQKKTPQNGKRKYSRAG